MTQGIDFDSLLNLEEDFYRQSYDDAFQIGQDHSTRDGKQFGIQTGFQRFILIGALKTTTERIIAEKKSIKATDDIKLEKHLKTLNDILEVINSFYSGTTVKTTNTVDDVNDYERKIKTIRSKLKTLYAQLGEKSLFPELESLCKSTAREIPTTQINGGEEQNLW